MGNQGNVERNSKVCVEVQTMKIIHDIQFWVFFIFHIRRYALKRATEENWRARMAIVEIILLKKVSATHFL